ncbi:MAG: polysaccharide deacetylase family protein [Acidobacteriota bacterium]
MRTRTKLAGLVLGLGLAFGAQAQQIAFTFDDLPAHGPLPQGETRIDVANKVIRALKKAHVPPTYGFVNGIAVQDHPETAAVLAAWRAAGNLLGNHTWSHMNLNQHSLQQFEDDTQKNEALLELQMKGADWKWFRFPYLAEGDTAPKKMGFRVYLAQHGYQIAGVTASFADYEWNEPYARCSEKRDTKAIRWLEKSYLAAAAEDIRYRKAMSEQLYNRQISYVLLMHIGAFDARMLPRLLSLYEARGFSFVPLEDAEKDPFYKYDVDPKLLPGPDTLEGAMTEKHLALPKKKDYSAQLAAICK